MDLPATVERLLIAVGCLVDVTVDYLRDTPSNEKAYWKFSLRGKEKCHCLGNNRWLPSNDSILDVKSQRCSAQYTQRYSQI